MSLLDTYVKLQGLRQQQEAQQLQQVHSILYLADAAQKIRGMQQEEQANQALANVSPDVVTERPGAGMTGMEEYDTPDPAQMITERTPKPDEQYYGEAFEAVKPISMKHALPFLMAKLGAIKERITKEEEARKNPMLTSEQLTGKAPLPMMPASTAYHYKEKEKEAKAPTTRHYTRGNEEITEEYDAEQKKWIPVAKAPRYKPDTGPSAASNRQVSTSLRKEFNNLGPVKEYREIENKFNVMDKAYEESKKTGNFVAIDQALITIYNKMTDPQSVVRESEYVRTPQDMAVMDRIKAAVARVRKGGRLEPDTRKALMDMASRFRQVYSGKFNDLAQEWREYAIGYDVDPNLVVSSKVMGKVSESLPSNKVVVKKFVSKSTGKTKYVYSDGTEEVR